jgi:hypothetical protein
MLKKVLMKIRKIKKELDVLCILDTLEGGGIGPSPVIPTVRIRYRNRTRLRQIQRKHRHDFVAEQFGLLPLQYCKLWSQHAEMVVVKLGTEITTSCKQHNAYIYIL